MTATRALASLQEALATMLAALATMACALAIDPEPGPALEEIVIGALIGIAAAWFVLPIRSTTVLRRRIADALAALSDALDPANAAFSHCRLGGGAAQRNIA